MKISPKKEKIKTIIVIMILIILLLLLIFIEDIVKTQNKNQIGLFENTAKAGYTTTIGGQTYDITNAVAENANAPVISASMMPVKYVNGYWTITTNEDSDWYDYSIGKPAYIMLNDGYYKSEIEVEISEDQLAINNIGKQISETKLGSIYIWIPRFAYDETGEIIYIKQGYNVAGSYVLPDTFMYETEKRDFSLAGVWVEYSPLSSTNEVTAKLKNMMGEDNKYGFIANTIGFDAHNDSDIQITLQMYFDKFIANDVGGGVLDDPLIDTTNLNRTILRIINTNQLEPIKAKAYYDATEEKIRIEVTYSKNDISKILDKKENILSENSLTADTGEELIGNGIYKFLVLDRLGNQRLIKTTITGLNIYTISNEEELKLFRSAVNNNKTNSFTIANQVADVKLNVGKYKIDEETGEIVFDEEKAEKWTGISNYSGKYYGNNHTISGLYGNDGLFYKGVGAQIEDLGIINSYLKLSGRGALLGYAQENTVIENCYSLATIEVTGNEVGGLVGTTYYNSRTVQMTMNKCYNKGKIIIKSQYNYVYGIGGIVGNGGNVNISNCYNSGSIIYEGNTTRNSSSNTGGIIGYMGYGSIKNCYNIADVNIWGTNVGGIGGCISYNSSITINCCYNYGNISGYARVGGVVGSCGAINNCYNYGSVNGIGDEVGGIIGNLLMDNWDTSSNLYNYGNVYTNGNSAGGVSGGLGWNNVTLQYSYNMGQVNGTRDVGGITGNIGRATIQYAYNAGEIIGEQNVGGIGGYLFGSSAGSTTFYSYITNCYNIGKISGTTYIGGVVGYINYDTRVYTNYSNCILNGKSYVGGITGYFLNHTSNSISNNYYKSNTANNGIGGSSKENGTNKMDDMPTIISIMAKGFVEDINNINQGYPILAWQTDNDNLNLINGDNAFAEDTEGINDGYPILAWQVEKSE